MRIPVDIQTLQSEIDRLAAISEAPAPVVTRVLFSPADLQARKLLKGLFTAAGLVIREDTVGNIYARWTGSRPELPAVVTGSHTDAIPNAGKYDGVVGVLGGLEAIRSLQRAGYKPARSIDLVMFTAEEPTRFGLGCLGSRLMAGTMTPERIATLKDRDGRGLDDWRKQGACSPGAAENAKLQPGTYDSFVELHIEQGPLLEQEGIDIGAVEKIAAPAAFRFLLTGEGGHAGAVLMPGRRDALLAGAEIALTVEEAARNSGSPDTVGTTGVFQIEPGAINSVPCAARLEVDFRDTNLATRDAAIARIHLAAEAICARRRVGLEVQTINADPPAICDERLVTTILDAARQTGCSSRRMISRAYHDSLFMAQVCPAAMIFIPCFKGYSHRPDEYSSPDQISRGVEVLALTLQSLSSHPPA